MTLPNAQPAGAENGRDSAGRFVARGEPSTARTSSHGGEPSLDALMPWVLAVARRLYPEKFGASPAGDLTRRANVAVTAGSTSPKTSKGVMR
jgi:hypothetical protein